MKRHLRAYGAALTTLLLLPLAACSSPPAPPQAGAVVASTGFTAKEDGFQFENYGDSLPDGGKPTNLTAADLRTMFGDVVCADASSGECVLIPEAQAWLNATNDQMAGGHCFGFSVAAELLWLDKLTAKSLGATDVAKLSIDHNAALQRQIAYDWALQLLDSVQSKIVQGTPNQILDKLKSVLHPHPTETYTIGIFKPDGSGGHAVTPIGVQYKGDGKYAVLIYDNNWPDKSRSIAFDTKADTWSYVAGTNPSEPAEVYKGDAETKSVVLYPTSPGLGKQPCPFCGKVPTGASATGSLGAAATEEIYLIAGDTSHADLVITDSAGGRVGFVGGRLVDDIRHSQVDRLISGGDWTESLAPDFMVPADLTYRITLSGADLRQADTESLGIVGPSFDLSVSDIKVVPGSKETLVVRPDATRVSFTSSHKEFPTIQLAVSDDRADYAFRVTGVSQRAGGTIGLSLPAEGGTLTVDNAGSPGHSTVDFSMARYTAQATQIFRHAGIVLAGGLPAELEFGHWSKPSEGIPLVVSRDGRSSTLLLTDQGSG